MEQLQQSIGFIGAGNMARAIIEGMIASGLTVPANVWIADPSEAQLTRLQQACGVNVAASNSELVTRADVIVIATKPYHVVDVLTEVQAELAAERHILISICAGVQTTTIESGAGLDGIRVIRVMPNTPALISSGSTGIAPGRWATGADLAIARQLFDSVGVSVVLDEAKLDAVTGLTGSGPAYVFRFMEVLIEAGVQQGLTREECLLLVPQMVAGAARMAVQDGRSLGELREAVTTPGGTTAAGLAALEAGGFPQLVADCVKAATERSRELAAGK